MKPAVAASRDGAAPGSPNARETSLESFVAQLHREGVASGQREAERLVHEARREAEEVLRRAAADAEALLAEAREQAAREQERVHAELQLAARDTVLQLQSALEGVLNAILERAAGDVLRQPEFLAKLVGEVVGAYARGDAAGRITAVHVPHRLGRQLEEWTAQALAAGLRSDTEIEATLRDAGFEYRLASGGAVEVSAAAVVERLLELVRPRLREIIAAAAGQSTGRREHGRPAGAPRLTAQHGA